MCTYIWPKTKNRRKVDNKKIFCLVIYFISFPSLYIVVKLSFGERQQRWASGALSPDNGSGRLLLLTITEYIEGHCLYRSFNVVRQQSTRRCPVNDSMRGLTVAGLLLISSTK